VVSDVLVKHDHSGHVSLTLTHWGKKEKKKKNRKSHRRPPHP